MHSCILTIQFLYGFSISMLCASFMSSYFFVCVCAFLCDSFHRQKCNRDSFAVGHEWIQHSSFDAFTTIYRWYYWHTLDSIEANILHCSREQPLRLTEYIILWSFCSRWKIVLVLHFKPLNLLQVLISRDFQRNRSKMEMQRSFRMCVYIYLENFKTSWNMIMTFSFSTFYCVRAFSSRGRIIR